MAPYDVAGPQRRRRPALCCESCRRRKIKCNRAEPCNRCTSDEIQCTYKPDPRRLGVGQRANILGASDSGHPSLAVSISQACVPAAGDSQDQLHDKRRTNATHGTASEFNSDTARSVFGNHTVSNDPGDLLVRIDVLENRLAAIINQSSAPAFRSADARLGLSLETRVNKTRLSRSNHWVYKANDLAVCFSLYQDISNDDSRGQFRDARSQACAEEARILLQQCKVIAKNLKANRPGRQLDAHPLSGTPADRAEIDIWTSLYLQHFEHSHRIVHVPTFMAEYDRYWRHPKRAPNSTRFVIHLAAAIGFGLTKPDQDHAAGREKVQQWVYAAQLWLAGPLEKDRLTIAGVQVHCLLILARLVLSIGGDLLWISTGNLVNTAMQIGLHRDPRHLPSMPLLVAEVRRRLWATVLELLLQSALDSEMPSRIRMEDFDTEPPLNVDDEEISEATKEVQTRSPEVLTGTSAQLLLLRCAPSRLKILRLLNGLDSQVSFTEALALQAELDGLRVQSGLTAPKYCSPHATPFRINTVQYLIQRFILHIHAPFLYKSYTDPVFYYSRKVCTDAALVIALPEPDEAFTRLLNVGGGLFKHSIRYAGCAISLELIARTSERRLDGNRLGEHRTQEVLRDATKDLLERCAQRVQHGESNVKMHMFLSMAIAEVTALEEELPIELTVARSACDSLRFCLRILEGQSSTINTPTLSDIGVVNDDLTQSLFSWDFDIEEFMRSDDFF